MNIYTYILVSTQVVLAYVLQSVSSHAAHMLINIHHMTLRCLQSLCQYPLGPTYRGNSMISIYTQLVCYNTCLAMQRVGRLATAAAAGRRSLLGIQEPPPEPQLVHLMLQSL